MMIDKLMSKKTYRVLIRMSYSVKNFIACIAKSFYLSFREFNFRKGEKKKENLLSNYSTSISCESRKTTILEK